MAIQWVFFDVGGPLLEDTVGDEFIEDTIKELVRQEGIPVTDDDFQRVRQEVIDSYIPSISKGVLWRFLAPDVDTYRRLRRETLDRFFGVPYEKRSRLRPGIIEQLALLAERYRLAIAANQPPQVQEVLERHGVWDFFAVHGISENLGLEKPDARLFLHVLEQAGCLPEEAVMIGDRPSCDIVPARKLGMKAILLRVGSHRNQRIRCPEEAPDREIFTAEEIAPAVFDLDRESKEA